MIVVNFPQCFSVNADQDADILVKNVNCPLSSRHQMAMVKRAQGASNKDAKRPRSN